jgi:hypothetical protein
VAASDKQTSRPSVVGILVCFVPLLSCIVFFVIAHHVLGWLHDNSSGTAYQQLMNHWSYVGLTTSAAVMAAFHMAFFVVCKRSSDFKTSNRLLQQIVLGVWILGPPIYFILEWSQYNGPYDGAPFEMFKMGQDLATKFWGGVFVILGALYRDW